jgi:hypothetical protein
MVGSRFRVVSRLRPHCPQKVGHCHIYCRASPYPGDVHTFRSRGLWPTFGLTEIDSLPGERTLQAGPSECEFFSLPPPKRVLVHSSSPPTRRSWNNAFKRHQMRFSSSSTPQKRYYPLLFNGTAPTGYEFKSGRGTSLMFPPVASFLMI